MNLIGYQVTQGPNIRLPLVNTRITLSKALGLGHRGAQGMKWSHIQDAFQTAVLDATQHFEAANECLGDPGRFTKPYPHPLSASQLKHLEDQGHVAWLGLMHLKREKQEVQSLRETTA